MASAILCYTGPTETSSMSVRAAALLPLALAASGCSGCHEDHPYVPYVIGTAVPPQVDAGEVSLPVPSASAPSPEAGASFAAEPATLAPPGLARWPVDGVDLQAPEGRVFVAAVVRDYGEMGTRAAFAIVRPPDGSGPGELVYYGGPAGALVPVSTYAPPEGLAHDAGCAPLGRLSRVGKRAVLVEFGVQCATRTTSAPARWVALVAAPVPPRPAASPGPALPQGVRFAATIADPPGAPTLTIEADTSDRDGDRLPDVALRVTLDGGGAPFEPGPRVSATLAWLDRSAGLSRDVAVTEGSFAALASAAAVRARSPRDAAVVPAFVAQARALWRAVCAEGGSPRLSGVTGSGPITCGVARSLEELGLGEARAYVTTGDPLRAALAIERAERPPAARTAARVTEAQGWLAALAPVAAARAVRAVAAVPLMGKGHEPAWGPLAFETGGKLLVRTRAGVVRVDPDAGDEADADGVSAWPSAVVSLDGAMRWIETYDPCDGLALRATFAPASGDDVHDVALPVAPPLGDRCAGSRGVPAHAVPVAWGPGGLEAIVEGEPVLVAPDLSRATPLASFLDSPALLGGPRSPDGKTMVVPTSSGLVVRSPSSTRLLRAAELAAGTADQQACTVSVDGTHVACVYAGQAWVGAWDAP